MVALTKLDTKNEFSEITFTTEEFSEYYDLNVDGCDRYIKDAINEINRSPIRMVRLDDKNIKMEVTINWFSSTREPRASTGGKYTFRFSEYVLPYISNLTNTYSKHELKHLTELKIAFNPALIKE
ncbi:replication initiation protein [Vibrio rumoiensis]|uniref:replication initiation protein n=1 Tax=Vibrio rumoiensis TaxID=76258 RepID=UPI0037485EE9